MCCIWPKRHDGGRYDIAKRNQGNLNRPKYRAVKRKEFVENWELYINFPKFFQCHPDLLPPSDPSGESGQYSFLCLENGLMVPTREWDLVKSAQEGKESVNLQIKLWSEGMWDKQLGCPLFFPQEIRKYCRGYPDWVYQSVINQTKKRVLDDIGFIPTWLKCGLGDVP